MSDEQKPTDVETVDELEPDANYQPPPVKSIEEIMSIDQEDESLRKYKEALLGKAQAEKIIVGELILLRFFLKLVQVYEFITNVCTIRLQMSLHC